MLAAMLAFFGVIIGVNVVLATVRQHQLDRPCRGELLRRQPAIQRASAAEGRAQAALGWKSRLTIAGGDIRYRACRPARHGDQRLPAVKATFRHPAYAAEDVALPLDAAGRAAATRQRRSDVRDGVWIVRDRRRCRARPVPIAKRAGCSSSRTEQCNELLRAGRRISMPGACHCRCLGRRCGCSAARSATARCRSNCRCRPCIAAPVSRRWNRRCRELGGVESARASTFRPGACRSACATARVPPICRDVERPRLSLRICSTTPAERTGRSAELIRAVAIAGFAASNIMLLSVSVWSGRRGLRRATSSTGCRR